MFSENSKLINNGTDEVRLTVPAKFAFEPKLFEKALTAFGERLGCPKCFSGVDCRFSKERDFIVTPNLGISDAKSLEREIPVVEISAAKNDLHDMKKVIEISRAVFEKMGCLPCHSGLDFRFRQELNGIRNLGNINQKIN